MTTHNFLKIQIKVEASTVVTTEPQDAKIALLDTCVLGVLEIVLGMMRRTNVSVSTNDNFELYLYLCNMQNIFNFQNSASYQ